MKPSVVSQQFRFLSTSPVIPVLISFWRWRRLWLGTTAAFFVLGLFYAVALKTDTWVATQGLLVRDEASGAVMRLGRFESQTQMKAAQELVLEMASSPQVVGKALSKVGRPPKFFGLIKGNAEFSPAEIESFGKRCVLVRAPRGAELGTTEVIYLEIKDRSKDRAIQLAAALCDSLELQLQEVRRARAEDIIQELQAALTVSESELARSTEKLKSLEVQAGVDLVDLRGLTDSNSGSTNRFMLDLVRDDLRKAELELQLHRENLDAVQLGLKNPELLMQVTDRLVETQPTIRKLREGLSEARLRTAQLQGRFSDSHSEVRIAKVTEQRFKDNLLQELSNSEQALLGAIEYIQTKIAKLNDQESALGKRLNQLADIRADYTNIVSEVKSNNEEVQQIRRDLTQALAAKTAASTSSLITRVGSPQLGDRPLGPGRTTIVGGSLLSGLFLGLGVVFMLTPLGGLSPQNGQRIQTESANSKPRGYKSDQLAKMSETNSACTSQPDDKACCSEQREQVDNSSLRSQTIQPVKECRQELTAQNQSIATALTSTHPDARPTSENMLESLNEWEEKLRRKFEGMSTSQVNKASEDESSEVSKGHVSADDGKPNKAAPSGLEEVKGIISAALEARAMPREA